MKKGNIKHRVYYYETDKMGRVYHSNFLNWMEEARTEYMREKGHNYKKMEEDGIIMPISEIKINYFSAVEYDDLVNIEIWIEELSRVKVRFMYEFSNSETGIKYASAESTNIFANKEGRPSRIPKEMMDAFLSE